MSPQHLAIDPALGPAERAELAHLEYLAARVEEWRDRGWITAEACAEIQGDRCRRRESIERQGKYLAAMGRATALAKGRPAEALEWAELARSVDPSQGEAWTLAVGLLWELERDDEALAVCTEATGRFPQLAQRREALLARIPERAEARRLRAELAVREREMADRLAAAKRALGAGRDEEAVELARAVLSAFPARIEALQTAAYSLQRLGRLDEAIETYETLARLQPSNPVWSEWVRNLGIRRRFGGMVAAAGEAEAEGSQTGDRGDGAAPDLLNAGPPRWSWSNFAAEFLEEHWQKLILCLAVLLIVVSSSVGAHLLLGGLLWQPAGKAALAMVWTILFAALGGGLIRWGAERAGRMMLVATLIVVPIHFMLAGESKLVTEPTAVGLAVAAVDAAALVGLVRVVAGMLLPRGPARFLSAMLLLLSVGSVVTARGSPVGWGWQFAAFQVPAAVFLGTVWSLGRRRWGASDEEHRDFVILVLGLLGFALLACTIRIGVYALRLEPALYAVPVMLGAISTVIAARRIAPFEADGRRVAGIRYGGYVVSGLAFAMAMTPPPVPSARFSANAVAASLLGFMLYAAALRRDRQPAFLYLSLGALVAARVGAQYFLADRIRLLIEALRQFLGYEDRLPWAYLSLVGLAINPALAALGLWFRRGWDDARLARHCQYIAIPVAAAACFWSVQESEAAAIVLSGYAVLFGLATWLYAVPAVSYAVVAAVGGASYFASTVVPWMTVADQGLIAAVLAWAFVGVGWALRWRGAASAFVAPWIVGSRVFGAIAFLAATEFIAVRGADSPAAAAVFALAGGLALIGAFDRPRTFPAALVVACFVEFTICGLALLTGGRAQPPGVFGMLLAVDGLVLLAVAEWLSRRTAEDTPGRPGVAGVFLPVLSRSAIGLALIADYLAYIDAGGGWVRGVVWWLGCAAMLGASRRIREDVLVYAGLVHFVGGGLALSYWALPFDRGGVATASMAVTSASLALILWIAGVAARRRGISDFHVSPCLNVSLGMTAIVLGLAVGSRLMARDAYLLGVVALALNVAVTLLLSAAWRRSELVHAAIVHVVVATYLVLFSIGENDPRMAYVLGLAAVVEAIVFWGIGLGCDRLAAGRLRPYSGPFFHATVALAALGILLSDRSPAVLVLAALAFLLTVKGLPRTLWIYPAVGCLAAACYFRWLAGADSAVLMAAAMVGAFGLWGGGVAVQRWHAALCERLGLRPLGYEFPMFHASMAAAGIAMAIRSAMIGASPESWTAHAWLPIATAALLLLMPRAYPWREWIHAGLAFLVLGVVSAAAPTLVSIAAVALAGMAMALAFLVVEQSLRMHEPALCERLGVADVGYLGVVRAWSSAIFGLAAVLTTAIVLWGMAAAVGVGPTAGWRSTPADWWLLLIALGLSAAYLIVAAADPDGAGVIDTDRLLGVLHAIVVLGLWWLGAAGSPLAPWMSPARDYFAVVTALGALSAIHLARRFTDPESWHELAGLGDLRSERARRALARQAGFLALLAVAFTGGVVSESTVAALFLAAVAMGLAAFLGGWASFAGMAGLIWAGAWSVLGVLSARRLGGWPAGPQATWAAWGGLIAAFSLWVWGGSLRRGRPGRKGGDLAEEQSVAALLGRFAATVERVASAVGLAASAVVLATGLADGASGPWATSGDVGVLFAAALLQILLASRWRSEVPAYLAQALMVGAYLRFRIAYPMSNAADAAVLTLLGYLDLGIAEALDRIDPAGHYTRPTRHASLVLPLLPLLQLVWARGWDDVSLFYLAAASTFYATACARLRWKTLGYAAAVLADAALWVTWSRLGWQLADHPQFYLIPVGLSAILFAEVNRELGRSAVNAIRTVGLIVIYASLALPVWDASFGAWVTLLLASLLGVFIGIGLRLQTFLWLGLATFVLNVAFEMGRVSLDHAMARWAIMLALGIGLFLFVALNEKKRILGQVLDYFARVRTWE